MNSDPKFVKISELASALSLESEDVFVVLEKTEEGYKSRKISSSEVKQFISGSISDSSDVEILNPSSDQILRYNRIKGAWENWTPDYVRISDLPPYAEADITELRADIGGVSTINVDRISNEQEAAVFLRNTTLGPTIQEIQELAELGSKRQWIINQISASYDNSAYSEWDGTGIVPTLNSGWFGRVALHLRPPVGVSVGGYSDVRPGPHHTSKFILTSLIRNNPVSGGVGSLIDPSIKEPRKSLMCKVVWVLNKLIPVSVGGGGLTEEESNIVVNWHGVLARHAFGNYADLLEDVAYNVSMSRMLTHIRNQKSDGSGRQPDENFGREIMQLFSIGLHELNIDGSFKLDEKGNRIPTYSQDDILESSKVFTGLTRSDLNDEAYYSIEFEELAKGGGVDLNDVARGQFVVEQTIYGIAKPVRYVKRGKLYRIYSKGTTDFISFGANDENPGTEFTAFKDGDTFSGTGLVEEINVYPPGVIPRLKHFLPWYETGEKRLPNVGIVIPAGTDPETNIRMMVEGLVNHPNCAPNICKNLIKLAVTSNPTPGYVARVASVFRDNGKGVAGDMTAVWTAIFCDPEANSTYFSSAKKGRVIDGFEAFSKFSRALDCSNRIEYFEYPPQAVFNTYGTATFVNDQQIDPTVGVISLLPAVGFPTFGSWPYSSPSVFSYYDLNYSITPAIDWGVLVPELGSLPANTILSAVKFFDDVINSFNPINWRAGKMNLITGGIFIPEFSNTLGDLTDIDNITRKLDLLLCGGLLSIEKKRIMKGVMLSMPFSTQDQLDNRVCVALQLIIRSPEFWVN